LGQFTRDAYPSRPDSRIAVGILGSVDTRIWARPSQFNLLYGIPRGSLYRILQEYPEIRTVNVRGPGSARLVNLRDFDRYLEKQVSIASEAQPEGASNA
jgi:hypothetical protein